KTSPKAYVVLVGISEYPDKDIKPRSHAEDDIKALYDVFSNKDYLGADPKQVRLLLGKADPSRNSEPATRENLLKALKWAAGSAKREDLVIFAFFGQGGPVGDSGERRCYFATDSTVKDRAKNAIAASEIGQELEGLKSQRFCALLEVNFTAFEPQPDVTLGKTPYREFLGDDGTEDHRPLPGRAVFLATNGLAPSLDLPAHGLFAQVLVDALKGAADNEGYEADGVVTVDELATYLDKEVPPLGRKNLKNADDHVPFHFTLHGPANHFALTNNPAVTAKVRDRLDKLANLVNEKKLPNKYAEEGNRLLGRMPRLESQRALRREYQKLVDGQEPLATFEEKRLGILEQTKLSHDEAMEYAKKVAKAIDTVAQHYVKEVNSGELTASAVRGMYYSAEEKLPADIAEKLSTARVLRDDDIKLVLADARERLGTREDLANHKDIDITLQRMLLKLDPHTTYFDPETKRRLDQEMQGRFYGIGVQIRKHELTDTLQVVTPIKDSPAYKAGIVAGDLITKITREVDSDGRPLNPVEVLPTKGLPLTDAVKKILGQPRTRVKITIQRDGESDAKDFEIIRAMVELESVVGVKRKPDDSWDFWLDPEQKIGYIRLTTFASTSARDMTRAITQLQRDGLKALVLDLRFNPGGVLKGAQDVANLFLDHGEIVSIKYRNGQGPSMAARADGRLVEVPVVCLINGDSASASEIVSAALQDHRRALVVGERSYGKGSVQTVHPFDGGALKLTTASFWRPNGKNLNKASTPGHDEDEWGVTPDSGYAVKLTRKERDDLQEHLLKSEHISRRDKQAPAPKTEFKDRQLESALEYLRSHS
ncbi:MAG TPA: S41 family peptidase, partial [Gemmataceae bacterium]|nr:S41 family peptidase [Gemmataceae bacterium]